MADADAAYSAFVSLCDRVERWPRPQMFSVARRAGITSALAWVGGIAGWNAMLAKAEASAWLTTRMNGFSLDWMLKPENVTKIMEGNYDDQPSGHLGGAETRSVRPAGGDDAFLEQCYRIARSA